MFNRLLLALTLVLSITSASAQQKPPEPAIDESDCVPLNVSSEILTRLKMVPVYRGVTGANKVPVFIWVSENQESIAVMSVIVKPKDEPDLACVEFVESVDYNKPNLEKLWGKILGQRI